MEADRIALYFLRIAIQVISEWPFEILIMRTAIHSSVDGYCYVPKCRCRSWQAVEDDHFDILTINMNRFWLVFG
ncbi:hypothetical protein BKK81_11765 [Cupriavidus sp. USMAHM13]|nr:hypothetical protein BKK81_11765 [Cupriavidus sp. USMAHM13]